MGVKVCLILMMCINIQPFIAIVLQGVIMQFPSAIVDFLFVLNGSLVM